MITDDLLTFSQTISGHFSNKIQALNYPAKFAHINIYFQPLSWSIFNGPGFYSEQSHDFSPWEPYRQAVHKLLIHDQTVIMENYKLSQPERLAGSGRYPELLRELSKKSFTKRSGCAMYFIKSNNGNYIGKVEPGNKCLIPRNNSMTYLVSIVELNSFSWKSKDMGLDLESDKKVWGSEEGLLDFKKITSFRERINKYWR